MTARARLTDPGTSQQAAASISDTIQRRSQRAVWDTIHTHGPLTYDQTTAYVLGAGWDYSSARIRTAIKELLDQGLLEVVGHVTLPGKARQVRQINTAKRK